MLTNIVWTYQSIDKALAEAQMTTNQSLTRELAVSLTTDFITRDYGQIESQLRHTISNEDIYSISLLDTNGLVLLN